MMKPHLSDGSGVTLGRIAPTTATWRSSIAPSILVYLAFLLVAVGFQWMQGAYQAEFGGHPDEAAHYVTGLMVRDYLAARLPGNPMRFAQAYYDHYPKVALGNWPQVFYLIQSAWTLMLTPSRMALLLLMAALEALVALITMRALIADVGPALAVLGGLLVLAFPYVQLYAAMVMTEVPVALFALLATLQFGAYRERGWTRDSVLFGLFASAAILTKGSGMALALVPVLAIAFTGRQDVLRRRNFWYSVPIVAVLCGPWTWAFRHVATVGWQQGITFDFTRRAVPQFSLALIGAASLVIGAFAIIGFIATLVAVHRGTTPQRWAAPAALLLSVLIFHVIVPASLESRHLVQALPAWAMFAVAGVAWTMTRTSGIHPRLRWAVYALAIVGFVHTASQWRGKQCAGFRRVVEDIVSRQDKAAGFFLVSSDATGEGMFIAETAMADDRPEHVVRRASKLLANQSWSGSAYQARVAGADALIALLKQEGIRFVVIDTTVPASLLAPHHMLLRRTAETSPGQMPLRGTYPVIRDYQARRPGAVIPDGIRVYEMRDAVPMTSINPPAPAQ
jgi:hypothetical protein